ncbi:unnamed protein product [Ostreobium quekettii]|uniref:Uncharacterized protein n=1 Tax=Ostreobium quekettii TaxID=121088 RepID=A0A8S1IQF3_9CHLO|nr:unnamed protein product [Ostreobium quekettii]
MDMLDGVLPLCKITYLDKALHNGVRVDTKLFTRRPFRASFQKVHQPSTMFCCCMLDDEKRPMTQMQPCCTLPSRVGTFVNCRVFNALKPSLVFSFELMWLPLPYKAKRMH